MVLLTMWLYCSVAESSGCEAVIAFDAQDGTSEADLASMHKFAASFVDDLATVKGFVSFKGDHFTDHETTDKAAIKLELLSLKSSEDKE